MAILKKAPEGANVLDLGAARAARAEARAGQASPFIKLSAGYVEIKPEIDILVTEDLIAGKVRSALTRLLADPTDVDALLAEGFTNDDLQSVVEFAASKKLGESLASSTLLKSSGKN